MGRLKRASRCRIIENEEPENEDRKPQHSLEKEDPLEIPVISPQNTSSFFFIVKPGINESFIPSLNWPINAQYLSQMCTSVNPNANQLG